MADVEVRPPRVGIRTLGVVSVVLLQAATVGPTLATQTRSSTAHPTGKCHGDVFMTWWLPSTSSERSDARVRWLDTGTLMSSDDEFEQFFLAHYEAVLSILVLTTGDRERATDATQEAFIKAYAKWSRVRNYDAPSAWVRRVAINSSHDSFRSDRRRRRREQALPTEPFDDVQTDRYSTDSTAHDLLGTLPTRQREVATLFYVDDCSVAEIAAILGLTEGTVKYHLSHARDGLRKLLADDQGAP